jgi:hypothetical protein
VYEDGLIREEGRELLEDGSQIERYEKLRWYDAQNCEVEVRSR